jgi:predicted RNA binding protein YcfA (HicA-like mRNA interferase family)
MTKKQKILQKLLSGSNNISFAEIVLVVEAFGFQLTRVNGSHHIFLHPGISELVNLQNRNGQAKPYQVRQFLSLVETYNLTLGDSHE